MIIPIIPIESVCARCHEISEITLDYVPPVGSENPELLIVGEAPGQEEATIHEPFVGKAGRILRQALSDAGTDLTKVRLANVVCCRPTEDDKNKNRTPNADEINNCSAHVKRDIELTKPKTLLLLGKSAISAFFPSFVKRTMGELRGTAHEWNGIPTYLAYHPSFILRTQGTKSQYYPGLVDDIKAALGLHKRVIRDAPKFDIYDIDSAETFTQRFWDVDEFAFDFEANMLNAFSSELQCAGLGIATLDDSAYISFADFMNYDRVLDDKTIELFRAFFLHHKSKKTKMYVFNLKYEVPVVFNVFGIELDCLTDTMQYCRTLNRMGGLKETSIIELGVSPWTNDVDTWIKAWQTVLNHLEPTKKNERMEAIFIRAHGVGPTLSYLINREKLNTREGELCNSLTILIHLLDKFCGYDAKAERTLAHWINTKLSKKDYVARYTEIPVEIVSSYCCSDCVNTLSLHHKTVEDLKARDIVKAAEYYNEHAYLGYRLELSGVRWDEELACKLELIYQEKESDCLKQLFNLPHVRDVLKLTQQDLITINSCTNITKLKSWFNPQSNTPETRKLFGDMIVTARLRFAIALQIVDTLTQENAKKTAKNYPNLVAINYKLSLQGTNKVTVIDQVRNNVDTLVDNHILAKDEMKLMGKYHDWMPESTNSETVETIYNALNKFMGVDPDDTSTWGSEMWSLHYFRLFKKVDKSLGTYINGKVGRGAVYKISLANNPRALHKRSANYYDLLPEERRLGAHEIWLRQPDYNCNSAVTKRWQSPDHVIPWNSELRDLQISRFPNGLFVYFDASQMEIRMLAVLADDAGMLEALRKGKDIHRIVASNIYRIPEDQITETQRHLAKRGTFAVLYGKTVEGFANDFMNKDLAAAKHVFSVLFDVFPNLTKYIEKYHKLAIETGEVPGIWNDPIRIEFDPENERSVDRAKRQAQNAPCQNSASNIAGVCFNRVAQWIETSGYLAKMFSFTHDSDGIDSPIHEVLDLMEIIPPIAEHFPNKTWGVPMKVDIEIGYTGSQMIKLKRIGDDPFVQTVQDRKVLNCKFEGTKEALFGTLDKFMSIEGAVVTHEITDTEDTKISLQELFVGKRAYSLDIGTTRHVLKGKLYVSVPHTIELRTAA